MPALFFLSLLFPSQVPEYSVNCDPSQFQYMMDNWEEEITIPCTVYHQGIQYSGCTMRIRGDTSRSFRKKSYRIEFPPDQPLMGRTGWNFNADYLDHSYMRAWLFSRVLTEMGFPVFQVSHARLNVNGDYRGLFILLEPLNESFLVRNGIDPMGNLYKAQMDGACTSIHDDVDSLWSKKAGSGSGMTDLVELIQGIEYCPENQFLQFMGTVFEMYGQSGLIRMLAINAAFANNSTYYHNYYLYHDVRGNGKWLMLPWDVDKILSGSLSISYGGCTNKNWYDNPVHARTLTVPEYRTAFRDTVEVIFQQYLTEENLNTWCDSLQLVLEQAVEEDSYDNTDVAGFHDAIAQLRDNRNAREADLAWQFQYKYFPFRSHRSDTLTTGALHVSWSPTQDPLGVPASYTVVLRDSLGPDSDELARYENIQSNSFTIPDLLPGEYWWTVETSAQAGWRRTEATDRYNPFTVVDPIALQGELGMETILYKSLSPYYITGEVIIPQGGFLESEPGVTVMISAEGSVNCLGDIILNGVPGDSIYLIAENSVEGWKGIRVQGGTVQMSHTVVSGSRGYSGSPGDDFAALVGHSAQVEVCNSTFRNNWSCVKLHYGTAMIDSCLFTQNNGELFFIEQGEGATVSNSVFENLTEPVSGSLDGIEFHLCTEGQFVVDNCRVSNIDGDCIDMNSSTVTISNTLVSGSTDKGFSIGAPTGGSASGTVVTILNSTVAGCPIGIAVKDGAMADVSNVLLDECETGLYIYEKTAGMGGGFADLSNSVFFGCTENVRVEEGIGNVTWSIVDEGAVPGEGNITGDPRLDAQGYPLFDSPCIDSGDPDMDDPDGSRRDMGPYFFPIVMNQLFVNELMAKNDNVILDDWGRSSDWIELFNGNGYDLDAGVLVFYDSDSTGAEPWSVPRGTMIPAGGFMLFWADGEEWKGGTHLPFRLSASGDGFSLGRTVPGQGELPYISLLEQVFFQDQTADVSMGRFPDGGVWSVLDSPTPGYSNGTLYSQPVALGQPRPNPCSEGLVAIDLITGGGMTEVLVYDLAGRRIHTVYSGYLSPGESTFSWNTETVPCGVYIVFARCAGQTPASAKVTVLH